MSAAPAPSLISLTALGTIEDMKKSIKSHADVDQVAKNDISVTRTVQSDETNDPSEYLSCVQHLYGPDEIPRGLSQSILIPAGATPLYVAPCNGGWCSRLGCRHAGALAGLGWKPGGAGTARLATTIALNSAPISLSPLPTRRRRAAWISPARSGGAPDRARALVEAERHEKIALVDRPVDGRAGGARAARHRGEVDMGGEVAFARLGQRIHVRCARKPCSVSPNPVTGVPIVDEQRRAALLRHAAISNMKR